MYRLLYLAVCLIGLIVTTAAAASKSTLQSKQLDRVVQLTDATFFDQVLNSTQAWMVMFYAPWCGHCRALEPEWAEAARTNGEWINYGAVDCTTQTTLAKQFKISAYPTMYVFPAGAKSPKLMSKYTGAPQHRAISAHALTLLSPRLISRPHDIRTLTSFLTKRSPSHTKVIVFATQRDALSIWQALSQHVSHVADVAYIPKGNDKLASLFSVRRYPTIIILRPPSLTSSSPYSGITYHGDLSLTPIKSLILSYHASSLEPSDVHPRDKDVMYHVDKKKHRKQETSAQTTHGDEETETETESESISTNAEPVASESEPEPTLPPGVVHDIITPEDYNEHCLQATGICVVMIVHDEESNTAGDDVVNRVASHYGVQNTKNSKSAQKQVTITRFRVSLYGWDMLTSFASSYDMTLDRTAPLSVVALIPRRNRYRIHVGVPDVTHITSFVDGVMDGSLKTTQKKDGLPSFQSITSTSTSHGDDNELCGLEPTPACASDHDEL